MLEAAQAVAAFGDGGPFDAVEVLADLVGGMDVMVEQRDEGGDRGLEVDVVLPEGVVGVDEEGLGGGAGLGLALRVSVYGASRQRADASLTAVLRERERGRGAAGQRALVALVLVGCAGDVLRGLCEPVCGAAIGGGRVHGRAAVSARGDAVPGLLYGGAAAEHAEVRAAAEMLWDDAAGEPGWRARPSGC